MNVQSPTFFFSVLILIMLMLSSFVYADEYPSFTQSNLSINKAIDSSKSAREVVQQHFENAIFGASLDQFFNYDLGINKSTGIKVHSSFGLKLRSDHTLLLFKMKF